MAFAFIVMAVGLKKRYFLCKSKEGGSGNHFQNKMQVNMRPKVPNQVEAQILFSNRHTCCHCRERNKDVQIHHIDENNKNNKLYNLAVLCLDCHSKVTGVRGLGKKYSKLEISKYKQEWESIVKKQFGHSKKRIHKIPKIEKQLFTFEIRRLIYEMMALDDKKKSLIQEKFELLLNIAIFEDLQSEIIDDLKIPFSLVSDSTTNKPILLAKYLPQFFDYLSEDQEEGLDAKEVEDMIEAIDTLDYILLFSVEENKNSEILNTIINSLIEFIKISIAYENNKIFKKSMKVLRSVKESCGIVYYSKDKKMPKIINKIDLLIVKINRGLKKREIDWKI